MRDAAKRVARGEIGFSGGFNVTEEMALKEYFRQASAVEVVAHWALTVLARAITVDPTVRAAELYVITTDI